MIRNLDPSAQRFLADLDRIQQRISRAERQITSGRKINAPSDAPDRIDRTLQLRADAARNEQLAANLSRAKTETATAERALQSAAQVVDRVMQLALQATSTEQNPQTRLMLAAEVSAAHEHLVTLSRTAVEGRYLFSGDAEQTPPYQSSGDTAAGVDRLVTAGATRRIELPGGASMAIGMTAQEIFDKRNADDTRAGGNVFAAVQAVRLALEAGDADAVSAALPGLREASGHINVKLASYGAAEGRIQAAIEFGAKLSGRLTAQLSEHEDTDLTAAILELNQGRTHAEAALSARARRPSGSLFDLLR